MALVPFALTTLEALKGELGIASGDTSRDAALERRIAAASEAIRGYCAREFGREQVTERLHPSGTLRLVLRRTPDIEIAEVREDGALVDPREYFVEDDGAGLLFRANGWPSSALFVRGLGPEPVPGTTSPTIEVVYTGGYVLPKDDSPETPRTLPYDLEEACLMIAVSLHRASGQDRRIVSETVGDASVQFAGANTAIGRGAGGIIPDEALPILNRYRRTRGA